MRSLRLAFLFSLYMPVVAFAKDKPRITIHVVKTETSSSQYTYTTPGREGSSRTNCATTGTTNGTINDYGVGPITTNSTGNANTDCTTRTTAAIPPQEHTGTATIEAVTAFMPDGSRIAMFCDSDGQRHWTPHRCEYLAPGAYTAEADKDRLIVYVPDISGKVRKVKYRAVVIERMTAVQPQQPVSAPVASLPSIQPSASVSSTLPDQSIAHLKEQATNGDANAASKLGDAYAQGQGVPKDYTEAAVWYRKAANLSNATAQYNLGQMYYDGLGVPQDYTQATQWYRKAADQGFAQAQYNLGDDYAHGQGVPEDMTQAIFWWHKAADLGLADAQYNLGVLNEDGNGIPQDHVQAAVWYRKAAEQGDPRAELNLGYLYANGQGVPQDNAEAYFWFDLAATGKAGAAFAEIAAHDRDKAASHLTSDDLSRAQERARKWFEDHPAKP